MTEWLEQTLQPRGRDADAGVPHSELQAGVTVLRQPVNGDLNFTALTLFNDEPVTNETVTVTLPLRNLGQTAAGAHSVALCAPWAASVP